MKVRRTAIVVLMSIAFCSADAAVFIVSNPSDSGAGTLRQAILDANVTAGAPHTIVFGPTYPDQAGIELFSALPPLQLAAEIDGADRRPELAPFDPSNSFTLLQTRRSLTVRNLSLRAGRGAGSGGCIKGEGINGSSALLVERTTFTSCIAVISTGSDPAVGGAIVWPAIAPVTIVDSIFQGNAAVSVPNGFAGGGAIAASGPLRVESSYFYDNAVNGGFLAGGAIRVALALPASIEILDSVFVGNRAEPEAVASPFGVGGGAALECTTCSLALERNYFGANRARDGGAVFARGNDGLGAAAVTVLNASFVDNVASENGGALLTNGAALAVRHASFHGNGASSGSHAAGFATSIDEWSNSVLSDVAAGGGNACAYGLAATSGSGNFVRAGNTSCQGAAPGSIALADPGVLGVDDGALMPVLVFDRASAVIDGGNTARCLADDARGNVRPQDGNDDGVAGCDAGAFEHPDEAIFGDGFES